MIGRLTRPVLRLGNGRVRKQDIQPTMHGKRPSAEKKARQEANSAAANDTQGEEASLPG